MFDTARYSSSPASFPAPDGMRWYWSTISAAWHLEVSR